VSDLDNKILEQLFRIDEEEAEAFQETLEDKDNKDVDIAISDEIISKYFVNN